MAELEYGTLKIAMRTLLTRFAGRTDFNRWRDATAFDPAWSGRAAAIASLVPPGARVLDVGAGRRDLERLLDPSCVYVPADLADRGPGTVVLDLNIRPLPELGKDGFDVMVMAGVIEYLAAPVEVLSWVFAHAPTCICSYGCAGTPPGTWRRRMEDMRRASYGWSNTFSENELVALFDDAGAQLIQTSDWRTDEGAERLFVFRRVDGATDPTR